jgi:hypothetical protein
VVSVTPEGAGVMPDAPGIAVTFGAPVLGDGVTDGRFLAVALAADASAVASAAGSSAGIAPGAPVVPARIALAAGDARAEITPREPLRAEEDYAVVVGVGIRTADGRGVMDPTGRRKAYVAAFRTGPMPDRTAPVATWAFPPAGPVPSNLRELRVAFSEAVTGALSLPGAAARARTVSPTVLALDLEGTLPPGPLAPSLDAVRDAAGNRPAALAPLDVRDCRDASPPLLDAATLRLLPADTSVSAAVEGNEPARLGLELAADPAGDACGAVPLPPASRVAWGEPAPCPAATPCGGAARCPLSVVVQGLCPGRGVKVRVLAEDLAGNAAAPGGWIRLGTGAGVPRPVLTEVLADAATPQAGGEFVEVANLGSGDLDLSGWRLAKRSASGAVSRCTVPAGAEPVPPGGHALLVGGSWDGRFAVPAGVPLLRCGSTSLLGGIPDDRAPELALETPAGEVASGFGWSAPSVRCTSRSAERVHPAGEDATRNYACAREPPGTPGACNGNTPPAECPARPW